MAALTIAGEGTLDIAVLRRLCTDAGWTAETVYDCGGKPALERRLPGFNEAAKRGPWLVLADLDDHACAADHARQLLPSPSALMCFRLATREVESWLIADAVGVAALLSISASIVPLQPDDLPNPKAALVSLARRSHSAAIKREIVPRPGSGRLVGPAYVGRLADYVAGGWNPLRASESSPSLKRAIDRLRALRAAP